jgi:hypothetical protein
MSLVDRMQEWAWMLFLAVFGWAWHLNVRVTRLELHQEYTHNKLASIDKKLDDLLERLK